MAIITTRPRGTLDKLPDDCVKCRAVENAALDTAAKYGYREIRTPVFEHTELFKRSVGNTTDIVQKEMYTFDDKKGRSLTLKPEGTAPVARAVIENGLLNDALPLKLCYVTNCYRYEAPQSGRYREFSQFGAEVYGADTPLCDAELIALAYDLFNALKMPDDCYKIEVNSIGCPDCRHHYHDALREYYSRHLDALCHDCHERIERNPMRLLDCKSPECGAFKESAPVILDYNCDACNSFFAQFKAGLDALNVPYTVNPRIVRGLDYYTNTVFEFVPKSGAVFGGGGRYNGLLEQLGGAKTPASGFALGIERIISFLDTFGNNTKCGNTPDLYVAALGESAALFTFRIVHELRKREKNAHCDIVGRSVKAQMRYADKIGARYSLVVGDNELQNGSAVLKNMINKDSVEVALNADDIIAQIEPV
ncbi:MAG: histidine--tRNA ligase [Oscillospiraceae bacterium]|nr:histidine--tRNA ligase [Oscillospiraceae bacterium]